MELAKKSLGDFPLVKREFSHIYSSELADPIKKAKLLARLSIDIKTPGEIIGSLTNIYLDNIFEKFYKKYIENEIYKSPELEQIKLMRLFNERVCFYISIYVNIIRKYFKMDNKDLTKPTGEFLAYLSRRPFYDQVSNSEKLEIFIEEIKLINNYNGHDYKSYIYKLFSYLTFSEINIILKNFTKLENKKFKQYQYALDSEISEDNLDIKYFMLNSSKTKLLTNFADEKDQLSFMFHIICSTVPLYFTEDEIGEYISSFLKKYTTSFNKFSLPYYNRYKEIFKYIRLSQQISTEIYKLKQESLDETQIIKIEHTRVLNPLTKPRFVFNIDTSNVSYIHLVLTTLFWTYGIIKETSLEFAYFPTKIILNFDDPKIQKFIQIVRRRDNYNNLTYEHLKHFIQLEINYDFMKLTSEFESPLKTEESITNLYLKIITKYLCNMTHYELLAFIKKIKEFIVLLKKRDFEMFNMNEIKFCFTNLKTIFSKINSAIKLYAATADINKVRILAEIDKLEHIKYELTEKLLAKFYQDPIIFRI